MFSFLEVTTSEWQFLKCSVDFWSESVSNTGDLFLWEFEKFKIQFLSLSWGYSNYLFHTRWVVIACVFLEEFQLGWDLMRASFYRGLPCRVCNFMLSSFHSFIGSWYLPFCFCFAAVAGGWSVLVIFWKITRPWFFLMFENLFCSYVVSSSLFSLSLFSLLLSLCRESLDFLNACIYVFSAVHLPVSTALAAHVFFWYIALSV